jgi:hypothetical protein
MSKVLEFFLGAILITAFTVAAMFSFAVHYLLRVSGLDNCAWHASARTWVDSNGDGRINAGELPLGDVKIHVDDIQNRLVDVSWPATTDTAGDVQLIASIPGCADTAFEIYVDIPEGYRITTNPRIAVRPAIGTSRGTERVYFFGFKSDR